MKCKEYYTAEFHCVLHFFSVCAATWW